MRPGDMGGEIEPAEGASGLPKGGLQVSPKFSTTTSTLKLVPSTPTLEDAGATRPLSPQSNRRLEELSKPKHQSPTSAAALVLGARPATVLGGGVPQATPRCVAPPKLGAGGGGPPGMLLRGSSDKSLLLHTPTLLGTDGVNLSSSVGPGGVGGGGRSPANRRSSTAWKEAQPQPQGDTAAASPTGAAVTAAGTTARPTPSLSGPSSLWSPQDLALQRNLTIITQQARTSLTTRSPGSPSSPSTLTADLPSIQLPDLHPLRQSPTSPTGSSGQGPTSSSSSLPSSRPDSSSPPLIKASSPTAAPVTIESTSPPPLVSGARATGTPPTAALSSSGRLAAEAGGTPDTPPPAGPRRVRLLLNGDVVIPGALDPGLDGRGRGRSLTRGSLSPKPGAVRRQGSVVGGGGGGGGAAVMRSPPPSASPSQFDFLPSPTAANVPQLASTPIPGRISVSTTPQLAPTTKPIPIRSPKAGGGGPPSSPSSQQRSW